VVFWRKPQDLLSVSQRASWYQVVLWDQFDSGDYYADSDDLTGETLAADAKKRRPFT
jgi:hypothetical protein